ncbi:unnamed protein product [Enterobius vermicularis]|uniref:ATP-dependent RNA helicase n=1 Tax=Enterobius vermicularis TaxID=51028 RepID=A0A0N4V1N9_ENTVE|nr:unnamed protein product [Enterobius vermicularis]
MLGLNLIGRKKLSLFFLHLFGVLKIRLFRKRNHIYTWGGDIPEPIQKFSDIEKIPEGILHNLKEFGITEPTPIQNQAIPLMLEKRELLASAPTGSGKTLAFALPIILEVLRLKRLRRHQDKNYLIAVILEPTKELAKQVYVQFLKFVQGFPVKCAVLEDNSIFDDGNSDFSVNILVSTPNRLNFALAEKSCRVLSKLKWLIIDEGDRLFETTEGEDRCFRNQLAKVYQACKRSKFVHHAFFSATYSYEVEDWCKTNLDNLVVVCVGARNSAVSLVKQELVFAGSEQGKVTSLCSLFREGFEPPVVVFLQSKDRAYQLFSEIQSRRPDIPAALISSDVDEGKAICFTREISIEQFREGKIWVLICTDLMGRGLDFRGVNLIINFDLPTSVISYIHRVGRAGRAGRPGRAVTYFTESDLQLIRPIATVIKQAGYPVPEYTLRMPKVPRYA